MNDSPIITKQIIDEFGIELNGEDEATFLQHLNDTLDERVGTEVLSFLDDDQANQLLDLQEKGNDSEIDDFLRTNVTDLDNIIEDERDILLGEVAKNADNIK